MCVPTDALAFRSSGDLPDFSGQAHIAFARPEIRVDLFEALAPDVDLPHVETTLQRSAEAWGEPGCTNLRITYDGTTEQRAEAGDGRNTIEWIGDWAARDFPSDSAALTDVQYSKDGSGRWTIAEADLYLNLDFEWTTEVASDERKSLAAVLTHELGHVLGLLHPCESDGADGAPRCSTASEHEAKTMYPIYSPEQTHLGADDVAGVCFLYSPICNDSSCAEGTRCVAGVCEPLCGEEVCSRDMQCIDERCRPRFTDCGTEGCAGESCTADYECDEGEFCDGRTCARGNGALGDSCFSAGQCQDGACFEGGCAERCSVNEGCRSGGECDPELLACTDKLEPMGNACEFSTDCRGGYCLSEAGQGSICSRSCDDDEPDCPVGWGCRPVEDTAVCVPRPALAASGGCVVGASASTRSGAVLACGALALAIWRTRWRRRFRRSRP